MIKPDEKSIYIISGPCGVGKSTMTTALVQDMEQAVLIEGDLILSMFRGKDQPSWESQLAIVWENISLMSRNFLAHGLNIIIDCVVETELEWFCNQFSEFHVDIYYVVLRADHTALVNRLTKRGDQHLIDRSLVLLNQLDNHPLNKPYLYDTTDKQPADILNDLKNRMDQYKL